MGQPTRIPKRCSAAICSARVDPEGDQGPRGLGVTLHPKGKHGKLGCGQRTGRRCRRSRVGAAVWEGQGRNMGWSVCPEDRGPQSVQGPGSFVGPSGLPGPACSVVPGCIDAGLQEHEDARSLPLTS